jgi:predicted cupin superfamily sugar epimerase
MTTAETLINQFQLLPHPEGGYFKETFRSEGRIPKNALPQNFFGNRCFATAIYFLLEQGNFSAFHKIKSDECWHFYAGETLLIHVIYENGTLQTIKLGNGILNGETFQFVVPANCWFACEPAENTAFSFVGCTVSPGFDFTDFELAKANELMTLYPQHSPIISRLCRQ